MYRIVSIDEEKESLLGYSPDKADDFHIESAKSANKKFDQELKKIKNKKVILMCGGSASGKTEFIEKFCPTIKIDENDDLEGIVFDSTLATENGAETKIRNIKKSGNIPIVCLILPISLRDSFSAFCKRDRKIPETKFYETHSGARKVALFLAQKYLDVEMLVYVNSYDRGNLEENELSFARVDFEDSAENNAKEELINFLQQNQFSEEEILQLVIENK
jgi:hypothetical protein